MLCIVARWSYMKRAHSLLYLVHLYQGGPTSGWLGGRGCCMSHYYMSCRSPGSPQPCVQPGSSTTVWVALTHSWPHVHGSSLVAWAVWICSCFRWSHLAPPCPTPVPRSWGRKQKPKEAGETWTLQPPKLLEPWRQWQLVGTQELHVNPLGPYINHRLPVRQRWLTSW